MGAQFEKGAHDQAQVIPTGTRLVKDNGQEFQSISRAPSNSGGEFVTVAGFVTDSVKIGDRAKLDFGARVDHTRAISQDLEAVDLHGQSTGELIQGLGTLFRSTVVSPRVGFAVGLTPGGGTLLRAALGQFYQGALTGEYNQFHPGLAPTTTMAFDAVTGDYTRFVSTVDSSNLRLDPGIKAPRTDEYSIALSQDLGSRVAMAVTIIHKRGRNYIAWTDVGAVFVCGRTGGGRCVSQSECEVCPHWIYE